MKFNVLRSSAGSGKTYALVRFYLELILSGNDPSYFRHVLAITFTNKATNEMKERILLALEGLADDQPKWASLRNELISTLNTDADTLRSRAASALESVLHQYGDFHISTIDRFVYRIIRSFAFELNLPANLEIELKSERLIPKITDALFSAMSSDENLARVILDFSESKFESDRSFQVDRDIHDLAKDLMSTGGTDYLEALEDFQIPDFLRIRKEINEKLAVLFARYASLANPMLQFADDHRLEPAHFYQGANGLLTYLHKVDDRKSEWVIANSYVRHLPERPDWWGGKCPADMKAVIDQMADTFRADLNHMLEFADAHAAEVKWYQVLLRQIHTMALANEIYRQLTRYKSENNLAQLQDFNHMIAEVVQDNPVPYIYERVGEQLKHYLVDEFQDTSRIQWHNLVPLLENALSEGNASLIVGDTKQAIYRWRGGDVNLLSQLPEFTGEGLHPVLESRQDIFRESYEAGVLNMNYRSSKVITDFVNGFFEHLKPALPEEVANIYSGHIQENPGKVLEGSVEVHFHEKDADEEFRLNEVLNSVLEFHEKGFDYNRMAVLCKTRVHCEKVAQRLIGGGIPVVSEESLRLASDPGIQFLVNAIQQRYLPDNTSLNYLILEFLLSQKQLSISDPDVLLSQWKSNPDIRAFRDISGRPVLESDVDDDLLQFCFAIRSRYLTNRKLDMFLVQFENLLSDFVSKNGNDPREFLEWWEEASEELKVEMTGAGEAVRILTIHKAKGLEFDVVLAPFMSGEIRPRLDYQWIKLQDKDQQWLPVAWVPVSSLKDTSYDEIYREEMLRSLMDTVNLIYVVFTRARSHLRVFTEEGKADAGIRSEEGLIGLGTEHPDWKNYREGSVLRLEIPGENIQENRGEERATFIPELHETANWRKKLQLKYRSEDLEQLVQDSARWEGISVHDMLSRINELDELHAGLVRPEDRDLHSPESLQQTVRRIQEVIRGSAVEPYFVKVKGKVLNEREIRDEKGERLRPDRCVIDGKKAVVIDYKTGQADESHRMQVVQYMHALQKMGYEDCLGYLLYFATGEVLEVRA